MFVTGGWLLVANLEMLSSKPPKKWTTETSYRGISNFANNEMGIRLSAMRELRSHLSFTQLRFYCSKQQGRTFHVTTAANSSGEAVVQYFSGQTDVLPSSCYSFERMQGDNSRLASKCDRWGNDGSKYAGKWGHYKHRGERRMYNHAAFIPQEYYWVAVLGKWWCDDDNGSNLIAISPGDVWKVYVRWNSECICLFPWGHLVNRIKYPSGNPYKTPLDSWAIPCTVVDHSQTVHVHRSGNGPNFFMGKKVKNPTNRSLHVGTPCWPTRSWNFVHCKKFVNSFLVLSLFKFHLALDLHNFVHQLMVGVFSGYFRTWSHPQWWRSRWLPSLILRKFPFYRNMT